MIEPAKSANPGYFSKLETIAFLIGASLLAAIFALKQLELSECGRGASLELLLDGRARVPYQYRCLVPLLFRALLAIPLFPELLKWLSDFIPGLDWAATCAPMRGEIKALVLFAGTAALVITCWAVREILVIYGSRKRMAGVISLLMLVPFSEYYLFSPEPRFWYPSDLAAVMFFALGIYLILTRRYLLWSGLFPFATLNRETTIFLILFFCLNSRGQAGNARRHIYLQLALWLLIKIGLFLIFARNPGAPVHPNFLQNLELLLDVETWRTLATVSFAFALPLIFLALAGKEDSLRAMALTLLCFCAGMLCVGHIIEVRIYGELIPMATIIAMAELQRRVT